MRASRGVSDDGALDAENLAGNGSPFEKKELERVQTSSDMQVLMLSVEQVCRLLGIGRTTLWAMVRDGELGCVKQGARSLFPRPVVEEYVQLQAARAREQAAQRQRPQGRRQTTGHAPRSRHLSGPGEVNA